MPPMPSTLHFLFSSVLLLSLPLLFSSAAPLHAFSMDRLTTYRTYLHALPEPSHVHSSRQYLVLYVQVLYPSSSDTCFAFLFLTCKTLIWSPFTCDFDFARSSEVYPSLQRNTMTCHVIDSYYRQHTITYPQLYIISAQHVVMVTQNIAHPLFPNAARQPATLLQPLHAQTHMPSSYLPALPSHTQYSTQHRVGTRRTRPSRHATRLAAAKRQSTIASTLH